MCFAAAVVMIPNLPHKDPKISSELRICCGRALPAVPVGPGKDQSDDALAYCRTHFARASRITIRYSAANAIRR
jgi:hypothetical protein